MGIPCTIEDSRTFTANRNLHMDLVFHAEPLADARTAPYRDKGLLLDVTFAEIQATSHPTHSSTSNGVAAAAVKAQKHTHYETLLILVFIASRVKVSGG
ncbi:unnamed protein product, partial [Choristocarpus tenellus]